MTLTKTDVRAAALACRAAVPERDRAAFAARLAVIGPRLVHDFAHSNKGLVVSLFAAIGSEPDLMPLAEALHAAGVLLALPVSGRRGETLTFRRWAPGDPTETGRLGIAEPPASAEPLDPDVLFVPLAAFDRRGHRIGYGAGYYDRTLAALARAQAGPRHRRGLRRAGGAVRAERAARPGARPRGHRSRHRALRRLIPCGCCSSAT